MTGHREKILVRVTTIDESLFSLIKGQLRYMSRNFKVYGVCGCSNLKEEIEQGENIEVICIPMTRNISPIQDLKAILKLIKTFKVINPDIVHSHTPKAGLLCSIAAYYCRIKIRIHTVAGMPMMELRGLKRFILLTTEYLTYKLSTHVIPNSKGLKEYIINNIWISKNKLIQIGKGSSNGIDLEYFSRKNIQEAKIIGLKQSLQLEGHHKIFLFVGRLVRDKGLIELVKAFIQFEKNQQDYRLVLVGQFYENVRDKIPWEIRNQIDQNPNIIWVGPQKDCRLYYSLADCFIFPSYREGFPNVLLEALAFELYCITTNVFGVEELSSKSNNIKIIQEKNVQSIIEAMEEYDSFSRIGEFKLNSNLKDFSRKYFQKELLNFYLSLNQ